MIFVKSDFYLILMTVTENIRGKTFSCNRRGNWTNRGMQQDLCLKGLGWDDPIPETSKQKWEAWLRELPKLEQFQIPRCFKPQEFSDVKQCERHHFSDASSQGYGAVLYLRQINVVGKVHCSLIIAKSRLAPLKTMTIPRVELSTAVLATRLDRMIKQEVTLPINQSTNLLSGLTALVFSAT